MKFWRRDVHAALRVQRRAETGFVHPIRALLLLVVAAGALYSTSPAQAASVTWNGLGSTNNWSEGANWSTGIAPSSSDIAIFDATSSKPATIDVGPAVLVGGIQITAGYTGTITQGSLTTTVGASGFSQADGTFQGSSSAITVNGAFTLSGGSFTSTTGTLSVSGAFTHSAGAFAPNGGTVTFTGAAATIDVPGTETFNNLTFAPTTAGAVKTITGGTTLIAQGVLTLTEGAIGTGTVAARGPIIQASTFDGGAGFLTIDGSGAQTLTGNATTGAGALPNLDINKPSGTLTLTGTIRTNRHWTHTNGTLDPTTSTVVYAGTLTITGTHTLNDVTFNGGNLTYTVASGTTLTVTGTTTLTDGSIAGTGTVAAQGPIIQASTFDGGAGFLTIDGTGAQTLTGNATTGAGALPNLDINKPSGTLTLTGTIRTNRHWTHTNGTLDPTTSTVVYAGTLTITGTHTLNDVTFNGGNLTYTVASGTTLTVTGTTTLTDGSIAGTGTVAAQGPIIQASTFDGGAGFLTIDGTGAQTLTGNATTGAGALPNLDINKPSGTLTLTGTIRTNRHWTHTNGTLDPTTSTVVYAGTLTITGTHTLNDVTFNGGNTTYTVNGSVTVTGALTLTDGSIAGTGTVAAQGPIIQASTFDGGAGFLTIDGTGAQTLTGNATTGAGALPNLDINKPSGTLTLTGTIRTNRHWTHTNGTLDPTTSTVVYAGTLTITGTHTLNTIEIRGAVTAPAGTNLTVGNLTMPSAVALTVNGSVTVTDTTTLTDGSIAGTGTVAAQGPIIQASTFDGGAGFLTIDGTGAQTLTGNATTGAGALPNLDINKPSGTLTLTGTIRTNRHWTHTNGTLDPTTSTVVYAGTLTITGTHTLNDVTFNGGNTTYTVNGSVTVTGALTLTDGSIAGTGTVAAQGPIIQASTFDGGAGFLTIDGTGAQTLTGNATTGAGTLPNLDINKPSGTLTLTGTIRTNRNWTHTNGTLDPTTSTVVYAGTLTITGTHTLNDVTFNGGNLTYTVASGTTLTVTGTTTLTDGSIAGTGTVAAQGPIIQASTFDGGAGFLTIDGTGAQTLTGNATTGAGALPNLDINKPSGTLTLTGTIRTNRHWTHTNGTLDPTTSTVVYAGTLTITGTHTLNDVTFNGGNTTYTVNGSVTVTGALTLTDGSIAGTGTVAAQGPIIQASTFDGGAGFLTIDGTGAQTLTGNATTGAGALPNLDINKPSGTLTLTGTIRTNRHWTHTNGTLDPTTSTVVYAGTLTITGTHTLNTIEIRGAVTAPAGTNLTVGNLTMPSAVALTVNGSVTVTDTTTLTDGSIAGTGTVAAQGPIIQASTFDGGAGFLTIDGTGAQTLTGNATTGAGALPNLDINKPSGTLTLTGTIRTNRHWTHTNGTLDPTTSTVVYAGTLTITGTHTLNDVTFNGGANVTLVQGPLVVTGTLNFLSGTITTGASKVVVSSTGNVVRSSGHVIGNLQKHVPIGSAVSLSFEIGNVTAYAPVVVLFGTVTTTGDLVASTTSGDHPDIANSGVSQTNDVNRWWTITNSATGFDYYDVTVDFVPADVDPLADTSQFIVAKLDGIDWTQPAVLARSATSIQAGGLTSFSDFVVGQPSANVGVLMVGSPEPVLVDGTLTYTVTVHNAGPSPATNVILTDPLPAGVTYQSATSTQGSCSHSSGTVTCALGDLAANASATVTIEVTATTPSTITNTVTITATETDPQISNNTATWTSTIKPAANVGVLMVGSPEPVLVDGTLTYTVTVHNAGPSPATNVILTDPLPAGVTYQSATSTQGSCSHSSGTVTCALGDLAANASATVTIEVTATTPSTITNTVTITATETDPQISNNTATWTSTIKPAANVGVLMVGSPEPVLVDGTLTYTVTVHNAGPSPATNVILTDPLPAGVTYQSATSTQGSCSHSSGTVTCALGDLAANASATVTIEVTATTPSTITNTVTITATETDPQISNNTATWTSTIKPAANVGVLMVGSPEPVLVDGTLTYTVTVHNAGPSPATNVILTDPLPAGVTYQSATSTQGSCSHSSGTVTCALGDLAANASATVTIEVTATTPSTITNTVTITATETDPQISNNTATWTSNEPAPSLFGWGDSDREPPSKDDGKSSPPPEVPDEAAPLNFELKDAQAGGKRADRAGSLPAVVLVGVLALVTVSLRKFHIARHS